MSVQFCCRIFKVRVSLVINFTKFECRQALLGVGQWGRTSGYNFGTIGRSITAD